MSTIPEIPNYYQQDYGLDTTHSSTLSPVINSIIQNKQFSLTPMIVSFIIVVLVIMIIFRKKLNEYVIKKKLTNTILLIAILLVLMISIVLPKWHGYMSCFKSTYKGNLFGMMKRMDFLYPYCRKELDSKGNYYFDNRY